MSRYLKFVIEQVCWVVAVIASIFWYQYLRVVGGDQALIVFTVFLAVISVLIVVRAWVSEK